MKSEERPSSHPPRRENNGAVTSPARASVLVPPEELIDGRYLTEFEKAIATDGDVKLILEYVHGQVRGPLLRQIRALQRAALIASACEHYALHGRDTL